MARTSSPRDTRRLFFVVVTLAVIASLVIFGCVVLSGEDDAPGPPPPATPAPSAARSASDRSTATLPDDVDAVSLEFEATENEPVLVGLSITATFTASTGERRALYSIVGMSCGSLNGPTRTQSVSGTENLTHQTTRQMTQMLSYDVETPGKHRCNATVTAPNWDPEYGDAELSIEAEIRLVAPEAPSFYYAPTGSEHPIVLDPGEEVAAVDETFPLEAGATGDLGVWSGTHVTTCTITNGSRDQTEANLCTEPRLDREGSTISTKTVVQQLDGDTVCRTMTPDRSLDSIDHLVHHRLLDSWTLIDGFLSDPCGDHLRVIHEVVNNGPAALVVHRASTNAVAIAY
ncbi:hypothetical protein [Brachybacterium sp.]|uniref:hypothetical protein n=1 Tax=Brachybacterium sp. TaxID=1891286 RepID=UPI003F8E4AD5